MSEFLAFVELGLRHIADPRGADHILFLFALSAIYRLRDWRDALWVITSFTVGHSITLLLAVTGLVAFAPGVVEFLIPVTIVATCIENVVVRDRRSALWGGRYRPVFAGVFGLVHGAGFANYLKTMFVDRIAVPLLGFNVGIELGQIAILALAGVALVGLDLLIGRVRGHATRLSALRLRAVGVSVAVALVASYWAVERVPW
ncbi:MAG: HupE/UreJ family protein [Gemmatimonadaceae bacterium]